MIRRVVLSLFAFAVLSAFADDPIYYYAYNPFFGDCVGYSWLSDFPSVVGSLFPNYEYDPGFNAWIDPVSDGLMCPISQQEYNDLLDLLPYQPFSSDPAYASPTPSGPPSGGGGSPSGGGNGEGGFDPVGSLSDLSSFASGLSTAVLGVLGVACFVFLSFIAWRKFRYSSKRV